MSGPPIRLRGVRARLIAAVIVALGLIALACSVDTSRLLREALDTLRALGPGGPAVFVALYVVCTVLGLPGSILTLGAGAIFGLVKGVATCWIAATAGATAAFVVGRYLARDAVARAVDAWPRARALDEAVGREGWKIVALARLTPVVPFNVLNYVFAISRISLRHYVLASSIGMLPGTVMYVYLGSLVGDLASLRRGSHREPVDWAFSLVGLLATVAVTIQVTRLARQALRRRVPA
jgi:uncharacterized membrane protein YdjX (TVP38/TMEM64 family)